MRQHGEQWSMMAKAARYPLCRLCREPIARKDWGKTDLCTACQDREQRMEKGEYHIPGESPYSPKTALGWWWYWHRHEREDR